MRRPRHKLMHAPIYRCRFNCSVICAPEEFAVDTLTNFLDSVAAAELADQGRVPLPGWCMSEDPNGFTSLGFERSRIEDHVPTLNSLRPLRRGFAATRHDCGQLPRPPCLAKYSAAGFAG